MISMRIQKDYKLFHKDRIWKDIAVMGMGTVFAQLINVISQPLLTRLFTPSELGKYTAIISLATIIIPVASLKLDLLIVSEQDDKEAQFITDTCVFVVTIVSGIYFFVIGTFLLLPFENIFKKTGLLVLFVPLIVFTNGIRFTFISYNNRYKKYTLISKVAIMREFFRGIIQVFSGLFSIGVIGLIFGYMISPLMGLRLQMRDYIEKSKERTHYSFNKSVEIITTKGINQIVYLVPAQFINSFSASLITLSITALFDADSLGYYSMGVRILDIPLLFITSNVSKVCYQRVCELNEKNEKIFPLILKIAAVLLFVSCFGFSILYIIAPRLAGIVFGEGYYTAGIYIRHLCLMYAFRMTATSFSGLYTVYNKQYFELILNILLIVGAFFTFWLCKQNIYPIEIYLRIINVIYFGVYIIMLAGYLMFGLQMDNIKSNRNSVR